MRQPVAAAVRGEGHVVLRAVLEYEKKRLIVPSHDSAKFIELVRSHEKAKDPAQIGETK